MSLDASNADARKRFVAFCLLGVTQGAIYLMIALWDGEHGQAQVVVTLSLFAFALYLAALWTARSLSGRGALACALLLGLIFRLLLLPKAPFLSDDYYRYLWDGLVQLRGINPYRYAPADPALAGIDDSLRAGVNHPTVPTIYPPLAQFAFALNARLAGGWLGLKLIWLLCDLTIAALLSGLLPRDRRLSSWTAYWWSPLVVIEVAGNAHLDLLGVLAVVLALWLATRPVTRSTALGVTLAAAAGVKYFAIGFLPAAARSARTARVLVAFLAAAVLLYLPFLSARAHLTDGLVTYVAAWRFNDGLFRLLAWPLGPSAAKLLAATVVVLLVGVSVRNRWPLDRVAFWITGAILLLSPTAHPWYLLWMVPLFAIRPNRAWLYLSGSVFLAYSGLAAFQRTGEWPEPWWQTAAVYGPFYVLLLWDAWRGSWLQAYWVVIRLGRRKRGVDPG